MRKTLRDIVIGLTGVWLLTFAAVFLNPQPHLLHGASPASLATMLTADVGLIISVICSVCALLRLVHRCIARRSA